jgi:N-methylhydantoinase B/oxoprolinase/acetone carboxylase alpha subunit
VGVTPIIILFSIFPDFTVFHFWINIYNMLIIIIIPKRTMISPEYPAAVIAGNVETSQYLVDTLFAALGVMAASQGTMNNTFWGNDQYQYYETVCGGSGATKKHHGASAVHTHMTNSRLTDPEILEWRFPVLLEEFSIRKGSGGKGMHTGGNGVVRRVQFLEKMEMSILAGHHRVPPYGMENGASGSVGRCWIQRNNNTKEILGSTASAELYPGDRLTVETPGGGGYGKITESSEY